jgi:histidyl-tRNA synthetase
MAPPAPAVPQGTRDVSAPQLRRRQFLFDLLRSSFERYGFEPLETPAMERLETLTGRYGEEGDRLIFKILDTGDAWAEVSEEVRCRLALNAPVPPAELAAQLCGKALRYDLTVPFARYVAMNRAQLTFPFRRFQMQPVWRADRPQRGRLREFYQCDVDIIGSASPLLEAELLQLIDGVFTALGLKVRVRLNDRRILEGVAELCGAAELAAPLAGALDKLDKIGREGVERELQERGFTAQMLARLQPAFLPPGAELDAWLARSVVARAGLAQLASILDAAGPMRTVRLDRDPTLARGLSYYTGAIFEVTALEGTLRSSIAGGGRYADLTGGFGLPGMSGVGVSFGVERIMLVLEETQRFPVDLGGSTRVLFANLGEREAQRSLQCARAVREAGRSAQLYPDAARLARQIGYAEANGIPYLAIIGSEELARDAVTLKDLRTRTQRSLPQAELISLTFT